MKVRFVKFLILALVFFTVNLATAQQVVPFTGGSFEVVFKANTTGNTAQVPISGASLNLDYSGVATPTFQVQMKNVKWDAGYENSTLVFNPAFVNEPKGLKKVVARSEKMSQSNHKRRINYAVNDDGTVQLVLGFGVAKEGEDTGATAKIGELTKTIKISGIKEATAVAVPSTPPPFIGWKGGFYHFEDGKFKVRLVTNDKGKKIYGANENPTLNFKGVSSPIVQLEVSNVVWNSIPKKLVVKNGWVKGASALLTKSSNANIELKGGETQTVAFIPKKNGSANISFQFGVGEANLNIGAIAAAYPLAVSFSIGGLGPVVDDDKKLADEEKLAFKKANESQTFKAYEDYLNNPKFIEISKFDSNRRKVFTAVKETKITYKTVSKNEEADGSYVFKIELADVKDANVLGTDENVVATIEGNLLTVIIKDGDVHEVEVVDAYERKEKIELNPESKVFKGLFKDREDAIWYDIKGGEPPYYLAIVDANTEGWVGQIEKLEPEEGKSSVTGTFVKADLMGRFDLEGSYKIQLKDSRKTETHLSEEAFAFEAQGMKGIIWIMLGVMLVLLVIILIVIKKNL